MKFIRVIVALLTVGVITNVAGFWVLDSTLLRSEFVLKQADSSGFYNELSRALPQFMKQSPREDTRANADLIAAVVTPAYVKAKFSQYVVQLEQRYRQDGPPPQLNLTDLAPIAKRDGFELPEEAISQPITLGDPIDPKGTRFIFKNLNLLKFGGIAVAIGLLGLIWLLAERPKRLVGVGKTLIGSGVGLLPNWLVFLALPSLIGSALEKNPQTAALAPALKPLAGAVLKGTGNGYLIAAGVLALLGTAVLVWHFIRKAKQRPSSPKSKRLKDEGGLVSQP